MTCIRIIHINRHTCSVIKLNGFTCTIFHPKFYATAKLGGIHESGKKKKRFMDFKFL